jgi:small basic protein
VCFDLLEIMLEALWFSIIYQAIGSSNSFLIACLALRFSILTCYWTLHNTPPLQYVFLARYIVDWFVQLAMVYVGLVGKVGLQQQLRTIVVTAVKVQQF